LKYRCEVDISFDTETDAVSFLNLLQAIKAKIFAGTGEEEIGIFAKCRYHECYHDETPPKQCGNYVNYDLKKEVVEEIKTEAGVAVDSGIVLKPKEMEI